jgi:hypothetical protein
MGKNCKFCGIPYAKLAPRHKCSYALYNKGIRHSAATVKPRETRQPGGWALPTWGGFRHLPSIEFHEGPYDAITN